MKETYDPHCASGKLEGMGLWFLALVMLAGCGYTLSHRLKDSFKNPEGLYVPVFDNGTDEIGVERYFTDALVRELQSRGEMVITEKRPGAFEFQGSVDRISYYPGALTAPGFKGLRVYRRLPTEIVVEVGISLRLVNPDDKEVLWRGSFSNFRRIAGPISRTYDYEAPSSVGLNQQSLIESQYAGIAQDIMRDVWDAMVDVF